MKLREDSHFYRLPYPLRNLLNKFGFEAVEKQGEYPHLTCPGGGEVYYYQHAGEWGHGLTDAGTDNELILDDLIRLTLDYLDSLPDPKRIPLTKVSIKMPQESWEALQRLAEQHSDAPDLRELVNTMTIDLVKTMAIDRNAE